MPASPTRVCAKCQQEKPTGVGFRDPGDVTRGRPPKVCVECRAKDPKEQAKQAENRSRREGAVSQQRAYAARTEAQRIAARDALHPTGTKTCPELSGCGVTLPVGEFAVDIYQADGLAPRCHNCQTYLEGANRE